MNDTPGAPRASVWQRLKRRFLAGLSMNIIMLGMVSLLTDVSSEMVLPILPLFLVGVIGASPSALGFIEGLADSVASILKVVSGWLSDKYHRRKPLIVFGYSISSFIKPFLAVAASFYHVLFVRVLDRIGKGVRTAPRDAMLAENCEECVRGKAFGLHRAMDTSGAIIGPAICYLVLLFAAPVEGTMRFIFLLAAIPAIGSVLMMVLMVKEEAPPPECRKNFGLKLSLRATNREFKLFLLISLIFSLGNFTYAFYILRASAVGISTQDIILFYLAFNVVYAAVAIASGILSDKVGRGPILITGYALLIAVGAGFAFAGAWLEILTMFIVYGLFMGFMEGTQRAYVADITPKEIKGTAMGVFNTVVGIVVFPASLLAGLLWDTISPQAPFLFSIATSTIALTLFVGFHCGVKRE